MKKKKDENNTGRSSFKDILFQLKQLIKFSLVGVVNTAIDFVVFTLLTLTGLVPVLCNIISYSCGVINSYFLNRGWTFEKKGKNSISEFMKFVIVNLLSLGASTLVLYLLNDTYSINVYLSKLMATFASLVINFLGSKFVVFK